MIVLADTVDPPAQQHDDLVVRLELAFRTLAKRVYLPSVRELRQHGVDKASYPLLALLDDHGDLRASEAAGLLELDLSTVSRQVKALEEAGLLQRRPDEVDGRASRLSLTELGQQRTSEVRRARTGLLDGLLADWSGTDRADLLRLVARLTVEIDVTHPHTHAPAHAQHLDPPTKDRP